MFFVSSVLNQLLIFADIDPARLNQALGARIRRRQSPMDCGDHFPRLIWKASSLAVARITRRNRYILLEIDDRRFRYTERSRADCSFICPGSLPDAVQIAATGKRLGHVVGLPTGGAIALGQIMIESSIDAWQGAVGFALKPEWVRFDG